MKLKFWGVRGSIPSPGEKTIRFGGNTTCLELRTDTNELIILDGGTGIFPLAQTLLKELPITAVCAVLLCIPDRQARQNLNNYLETWRHVKPKTDGNDLKQLGLVPGPRYQQILSRLRQAWLDGEVESAASEERLLSSLLK